MAKKQRIIYSIEEGARYNICYERENSYDYTKISQIYFGCRRPQVGDTISYTKTPDRLLLSLVLNDELLFERSAEEAKIIADRPYERAAYNIVKTIAKAEDCYHVCSTTGTGFAIFFEDLGDIVPKAGDHVILFLKNGSSVVGIEFNSKLLFLRTKEEQEQMNQQFADGQSKEDGKSKIDIRFDSMPRLLQHRIMMFRKYSNDFKYTEEYYEGRAMTTAFAIFSKIKSKEEMQKFELMCRREQVQLVPELKQENIKGDLFAFAFLFASLLADDALIMDIDNPSKEELLKAKTMSLPNVQAPISGHICFPRAEFISKYVESL